MDYENWCLARLLVQPAKEQSQLALGMRLAILTQATHEVEDGVLLQPNKTAPDRPGLNNLQAQAHQPVNKHHEILTVVKISP